MLSNMLCSTSYDCKYRELFSIMNSGFSIDRDTKMAVSLSPNLVSRLHNWATTHLASEFYSEPLPQLI